MNSIRCPQCNFLSFTTATECKRCKHEFQTAQVSPSQHQSNYSETKQFGDVRTPPPDNYRGSDQSSNYQDYKRPNAGSQNDYSYQNSPRYQTRNQKLKTKLAVISLIFGIASFPVVNIIIGIVLSVILANIFGVAGAVIGFILPLITIPTALVTGIVSLVRANKRPLEYGGKGFAIAGIVISGISLLIIPIVTAIAIPNLLAARRAANESAAIASIRTIAAAENTYLTNRVLPKNSCVDLAQLSSTGAINPSLASGTHSGYQFVLTMTETGCEISAMPAVTEGATATGIRSFYAASDENWSIRVSEKKATPANRNDIPLESRY